MVLCSQPRKVIVDIRDCINAHEPSKLVPAGHKIGSSNACFGLGGAMEKPVGYQGKPGDHWHQFDFRHAEVDAEWILAAMAWNYDMDQAIKCKQEGSQPLSREATLQLEQDIREAARLRLIETLPPSLPAISRTQASQ